MRTALLALACLSALSAAASADEKTARAQHLESQNDFGFDIGHGRLAQRYFGRLVINDLGVETRAELHYGLAWRIGPRMTFDLTAGYAYADSGPNRGHALVLGTWKDMRFADRGALRVRLEGLHRYDGSYRYDGFYSVDWWMVGAHAENRGRDVAAGFQTGTGPGLLPFRFDIRISFGLSDGMPERSARFVMSFDVR